MLDQSRQPDNRQLKTINAFDPCYTLRRPIAGLALAVVTGMAAAAVAVPPPGRVLIAAAFTLLFSALLHGVASSMRPTDPRQLRLRRFIGHTSAALLFCGAALISAGRYAVSDASLFPTGIDRLRPELPLDDVELTGRVIDDPAVRGRGGGVCTFTLRCESLATDEIRRPGRGRVAIVLMGGGKAPPRGARLRLSGTLQRRSFPGGCPIELVVRSAEDIEWPGGPPRGTPSVWIGRLRSAAARRLAGGIGRHTDQLAVYRALLLGCRESIPPEIYRSFRQTGTLHIFAISGLHVGIMVLLITGVLKAVGIPRSHWGLALLPLLGGYVWMTGMKTSALRALTMAAVFFLAPLFRRRPDVPAAVALAATLMLWCRPKEITSVGFILSFTVVTFIVILFSVIPKGLIFCGTGWLRNVRAYLLSLSVTSLAAFIASSPVTLLFFGSFTPVGLAANLAVVPLTFAIVLCGWLAILLPPASALLNHAALGCIDLLLWTVDGLARLPGAGLRLPPPPLTALLFWYAGWISLLLHARTARQRRAALLLILLAVILFAAR